MHHDMPSPQYDGICFCLKKVYHGIPYTVKPSNRNQLRGNDYHIIIEGSLGVKLMTTWRDGKAEVGRVREEKRREEERSEKRKSQRKEDAGARKGRKVAKHYVFQ